MQIDIHPNAKKNIDLTVRSLIGLIKEIEIPKGKVASKNEIYTSTTITDDEVIGDVYFTTDTRLEGETSKSFMLDKRQYGLFENNYKKLLEIASGVYKIKSINKYLSLKYIETNIFIWVHKTFIKEIDQEYTEFLLKCAEEIIKEFEIMIPVPFTIIHQPIKIGHILLQTLSESMIESWFSSTLNDEKMKNNIEQAKLNYKKDFQGFAVGIYKCMAEQERASEYAYEHFSNALSVLRLFSPANYHPAFTSNIYEYGHGILRIKKYFCIDKKIPNIIYSTECVDNDIYFEIPDEMTNQINDNLTPYNILLTKEKLNPFQEKLFEAIIIYAKNTLRIEVFDKILYILVSLESLLLKNDTEPIQQNVADRLAFLIGNTTDERKMIVKNLKDIYAIRSKYIHHGVSSFDDDSKLSQFMINIFAMFNLLVKNMDNFNDKNDLIKYLDDLKYS